MFKSKAQPLPPETDFTNNLRETSFYRYGLLRSLGLTGDVTAIAVDPILSLFAVGTSSGYVHCFGQSALQFSLPVSAGSTSVPVKEVKFLAFHPGHQRLIIIDDGNTLHTYDLANISDHPNPTTHPPLPVKEISYTLWGTITSIEQPSSSYTHLFFTMKDGTTLAWDLSRRMIGNWKIGNCWHEYEDRMFRSGIPGRQRTAGGPMATCLAINPRDLNIMLIGYEGGVVAWNFQKNVVEKTFEMTLPPGAPGGGSYQDASGSLWTERTPSVSCLSWRPDGQVFAVGHFDGCITFWAYGEPDKPLMVRTITHEDVNVTDADELFSAGVLDKGKPRERDADGQLVISAVSANREPIFKLTWASFPDQASLRLLATAQAADETLEPVSNATMEYAERGETLLLVLGGQSPGEKPGINILQFPAYQPPLSQKARPSSPNSESMPVQERYAYRDSLAPTGSSFYATATPPEDFVLMPRNSPYFNLSLDPIAIFVTLTPDPNIAKPESGRMAERGIEAWAFPPPRSTVIPASPGRKNYVQPGEGEKAVAMTPAPVWTSPQMTPRAASPSAGWRLPWSSGSPAPSPKLPPSPLLRVPTPDSAGSSSSLNPVRARTKIRKRYRLPAQLWSGAASVLTSDIHSLPTPLFKRLITWSIDHAEQDLASRVPLQGGLVVPDLQSHGAPDVKVAKMESYRIMVTSHSDATVRFWDISPHLVLLPSPLHFEYPNPLPHLTISIAEYLKHPDVKHLPLARLWEQDRSKVRIKSVHLAREALECTITMVSGEVIVTKFGEAKKGSRHTPDEDEDDSPKDSYFPKTPEPAQVEHKAEYVEEITEIGHLAKWNTDGFKPVAIFTLKRGEPLQCSVSDIGFIAVAFSANSLAILDMRGPDVILREGFDEDGVMVKKRRKKGNVQNVPGKTSQVGALQWVVAGLGNDPSPRPRLIVSYVKGMTKIYTLANVLGEWVVEAKPPTFTNESLSFPVASFVIEPLGGAELLPTAEALQGAMQQHQDKKDGSPHCLWIAVARKSIRIAVNFNGERVSKVEMMEEDISSAFYVTRHGQKVLVIITARGSAVFYSLPFLTLITSLELYYGHQQRPIGRISMDDRSGDFIEHISPIDINLRTLFHFRKPFPPRYDPTHLKRAIPPQPLPLTYSTIGWLMGSGPLTGAQLDTIVAGPSRPPPPKTTPSKPLISWGAAAPSVTWGKPVEKPPPPPPPPRSEVAIKRTAVTKQTGPSRDHREREDAYTEMRNATAERGHYLDTLGDSINNVSISAGNYLSQARNAAVKEAAKGSIKSAFGKLM